MVIYPPFEIMPRLLPGLRIAGAFVSIDYADPRHDNDGCTCYVCYIDSADGKELGVITDLKSGCQGGGLQLGLESLLSFLGACAEGQAFERRTGRVSECSTLFAEPIRSWCNEMAQEIDNAKSEIDNAKETRKTLIEE